MNMNRMTSILGAATLLVASTSGGAIAHARPQQAQRHVLLISVDGLHASDLQQWVAQHPTAQLARLSRRGLTYSDAHSSEPSM